MTGRPVCPECATPVELDWEWCHGCGFDPDGKLAEAQARGLEPVTTTASGVGAPPAPTFDAEVAGQAFPGTAAPTGAATPFAGDPFAGDLDSRGDTSPLRDAETFDPAALDRSFEPASFESTGFESTGFDPAGFDPGGPAPEGPAGGGFDPAELTVEAPGARPSSFLDDVPTPAQAGMAPGGPAVPDPDPTGGTSPGDWQRDRPRERPIVVPAGSSGLRTPAMIALGVVVVLVIGFVFVKMGSNDREQAAVNPDGPPPAGEATLITTPSTLPPTTVAPGWIEHRSADGRFIAGFPVVPRVKNVVVAVGDRSLSAVEVAGQEGPAAPAFAVQTIEVPSGMSVPDAQAAFHLLTEQLEVVGSEPFAANGLDGVRFTAHKDGATLDGLVYVKGTRIFYLVSAGVDPATFDLFASSFQLIER